MDARYRLGRGARTCRLAILFLAAAGFAQQATAQRGHRTQNFLVQAPSQQLAKSVGDAAEQFRSELAMYWLGHELPPWPNPCPIRVVTGPSLPAQGVTTYQVGPVRDFQMEVVGTPTRILDSVLPHEVTHTILASHFGRPLPRWADEGVCTTVEHDAEKSKHEAKLREFLTTNRGIPMNKLFLLKEYPQDVLPMYAQGYSVCQFLIAQQGPRPFIQFLEDYMQRSSWTATVQEHYGYESLAELQQYWLDWIKDGGRSVEQFVKQSNPPATALAANAPASASQDAPSRTAPGPRFASARDGQEHRVAPASAITGADGEGWYLRRRQQAASRSPAGAAPAAPANDVAALPSDSRTLPSGSGAQTSGSGAQTSGSGAQTSGSGALPSRQATAAADSYSAAQPQPEQQIGSNPWPQPTPLRGDVAQPWRPGSSSKWR